VQAGHMTETSFFWAIHILIDFAVIVRILLRPHREPASRIAWIVVVATLPVAGVLAYLMLGEVNIGQRHYKAMRKAFEKLPVAVVGNNEHELQGHLAIVPERYRHLFRVGHSISGMDPVSGNSAELQADSNSNIEHMVKDIDSATEHVHLLFYIWLADNNGCKIVDALKRAASRGVTCRAMADGLGSRALIKSRHWKDMREAGVKVAVALPFGNPLLRPLRGRIDLRNHRKIVVIDHTITYCGSQNCADPEFLVKARYAPWVDAVVRFEGPIARQNQYLFASDWMSYVDENLESLFDAPTPAGQSKVCAQVIGTGPVMRNSSMPEVFESLMHSTERELVISTPYYVPNEAMQAALCAAAHRGVDTTLILPAKNDSWVVAAASRSYYLELLNAGVKIREYVGGLLHAKTLTVDGQMTLVGSANMDRRSFDLNFENNILVHSRELTESIRQRQQDYLSRSNEITLQSVQQWPLHRQLWNNTVAILGPVL
jgi:cardiolipin synthase